MNARVDPTAPPLVRANWHWASGHEQIAVERIRQHVCSIRDSTSDEDLKHGTDYVIRPVPEMRVAMRVRRLSSSRRHVDFTLRAILQSGSKTEIEKLAEEPVDLYCYVWVDDTEQDLLWQSKSRIHRYVLIDFRRFVEAGLLQRPDGIRWNRDRGSAFAHWSIDLLQDCHCIVEGCKYLGSAVEFWMATNYQPDQRPA